MQTTVYTVNYWEKTKDTPTGNAVVSKTHPAREAAIAELLQYVTGRLADDDYTKDAVAPEQTIEQIERLEGDEALEVVDAYFYFADDELVDAGYEILESVIEVEGHELNERLDMRGENNVPPIIEDDIAQYYRDQVEDGGHSIEDLINILSRYALMDPAQVRAEMSERIEAAELEN